MSEKRTKTTKGTTTTASKKVATEPKKKATKKVATSEEKITKSKNEESTLFMNGYFRKIEPATKGRMQRFRVLVDFFGRDVALEEFRKKYKAPFGRYRAYKYEFNIETHELKIAGVVDRPSDPDIICSANVMREMVETRFSKYPIIVRIGEPPKTNEEMRRLVVETSCSYGVSSDNKKYRQYVKDIHKMAVLSNLEKSKSESKTKLKEKTKTKQAKEGKLKTK